MQNTGEWSAAFNWCRDGSLGGHAAAASKQLCCKSMEEPTLQSST